MVDVITIQIVRKQRARMPLLRYSV